VSDRWAVADLLAAPIMSVRRNRAIVAEAARATRVSGVLTADFGPVSTGPIPAPAPPPPGGASQPGTRSPVQARGHESTPPEGWLRRLMACSSWGGRRLELEEQLSALVATELRRLTLEGSLRAVWTCNRVEVRRGGRIASMQQALGRVLGVVPGCPDFLVLWGTGAGLVELKTERAPDLLDPRKDGGARAPTRTYLRPIQKDFREWCVSNGVKHACCRSVNEVKSALREWGRLM
jgi:hypothetical protein